MTRRKFWKVLPAAAVLSLGLLVVPGARGVEGPNESLGKKLFESTQLGTNGRSCAVCHPTGKGLEEIGAYSDQQLKEMINFCIRDALKGRMFDLESTELSSMLFYVRGFSEKPASR